jgi:hypothetical protein
MASHKAPWGPVEARMMEEIFAPEILRHQVPGMAEVLDGAAHLRAMHEEIGTLAKYHGAGGGAGGFTHDHSMQVTSKIDTNIMVMLEELHEASCTCRNGLWGPSGHKSWYYAWLSGPGRAHDVRGKIIL